MKEIYKKLIIFIVCGSIYTTLEVLHHQSSHYSMTILAGLVVVCIDLINEKLSWETPLWIQGLIGMIIATTGEGIVGLIVNNYYNLSVWDYSDMQFQFFFGNCCLLFTLLWFPLSLIGIVVADYIRYLLGEEKPRYKLF